MKDKPSFLVRGREENPIGWAAAPGSSWVEQSTVHVEDGGGDGGGDANSSECQLSVKPSALHMFFPSSYTMQ